MSPRGAGASSAPAPRAGLPLRPALAAGGRTRSWQRNTLTEPPRQASAEPHGPPAHVVAPLGLADRLGLRRTDRGVRPGLLRRADRAGGADVGLRLGPVRRQQGWNAPENFTDALDDRLLLAGRLVHRQVHRRHHRDPAGPGPRAGAAGAGVEPLERASCAPRSWCRARSAWPRPRCCSTPSTPRRAARSTTLCGPPASPTADLVPRHPDVGACGRPSRSSSGASPASTCCCCSSACRASRATSTRRPGSTAPAAGRPSGYVTLPLLRSSLALCTILCVTGSLLAFDQFYILTKGGPDNSTITIVQLIYNMAFQGQNDLGRAAGAVDPGAGRACWSSTSCSSAACAPRGELTDRASLRRARPVLRGDRRDGAPALRSTWSSYAGLGPRAAWSSSSPGLGGVASVSPQAGSAQVGLGPRQLPDPGQLPGRHRRTCSTRSSCR